MGRTRPEEVRPLYVDTNILIRILTNDPPSQADRATRALRLAHARGRALRVSDAVVIEAVHVLQSVYGLDRIETARRLIPLLAQPELEVGDAAFGAFDIWLETNIDFTDAYVAAIAREGGAAVLSFDRDFDAVEGVDRVEPGSIR